MRKHIKECITCQQLKTARGLQMQWQELPLCNKPLERISMDITDMHTSNSGHRYVLTLIDHYSRYVKFIKMRSRLAEEVVKGLQTYMGDFGAPKVLLTDNAREFHATIVKDLCTRMGTQLVFSTPYHPQGNSISERMHRTMKSVLATLCRGHPHRWPNYLWQCQTVLNAAVHETTGEQPFYLMFFRYAPRSVSAPLPQDDDDADIKIAHEVVKETNRERAQKWRDKANRGRTNQRVELNSLVWVKKEQGESSVQRKLGVKWLGPYKVKEILRDGSAYVLENVFNGTQIQRAAEKIKPYVGKEQILIEQEEVLVPPVDDSDEDEVEQRPTRERRPPRRLIEEV